MSFDELAALNTVARKKHLKAGETLFWEGDKSVLVANVVDGVLKLSTSMSDGREQIVGVAFPSDFIGRPFGGKSFYTVTALSDVHLCTFSRQEFEDFATKHPALEHKLLDRTLGELDRAREWMLLLGRKTASEKTASFLMEMSSRLGKQGCDSDGPAESFILPLGRQQIADVLGLTIETVSRQMSQMKRDGLIDLPDRRTVTICDREALLLKVA